MRFAQGRALLLIGLACALIISGCKQGVHPPDPLVLAGGALPAAAVGTTYSTTLPFTGAVPPIRCTLVSGTLPAGLQLGADCTITGTPTEGGVFTFTIRLEDSDGVPTAQQGTTFGRSDTATFTLTVIGDQTAPNGVQNRAYSFSLQGPAGGTLTWTVAAGSSLPPGMVLSAAGVLSGTPTSAGAFTFDVNVVDSTAPTQTATATITLTINPPLAVATQVLANGFVGSAYSQTLAASGGNPGYTWSVVSGSLPGVTFTSTGPTVGIFSGTPTTTGSFTFTVRVTDTANAATAAGSAQATFTVLILSAPTLYVANSGDGTVTLIDITTNTVSGAPIAVGTTPTGVTVTPDGTRVYVSNFGSNDVSVIDTLTNTVTGAPIPVGTGPMGIVATPEGASVFVANQTSNTVSVIDTGSNTVVLDIPMPIANGMPTGLAVSAGGRFIFATLQGPAPGLVVTINNDPASPAFHTIVGTTEVGPGPLGIAFSGVSSQVYVANSGDNTVSIIQADLTAARPLPDSATKSVTVGASPSGVGVGPNCNFAHVSNSGDNTVTLVQTAGENDVLDVLGVGAGPQQFAYTADGRFVYVTNATAGTVTRFENDSNPAVLAPSPIAVGTSPMGIGILADTISLRLLPPPPPPSSRLPDAIVGEPYTQRVCVAGGTGPYTFTADSAELPPGLNMDNAGLISGEPSEPSLPDFPARFVFTVTVTDSGSPPLTLSGDYQVRVCCIGIPPLAYVANFDSNSVTVFETVFETVVATITTGLGTSPLGVAITPNEKRTYVTNFNSASVSVIDSDNGRDDGTPSPNLNTVIATVAVGNGPAGVAVTPNGAFVYVTNENDGTVSVISTASNTEVDTDGNAGNGITRITVGNQAEGIAITPNGTKAYVANVFSNNVSVIDIASNTVTATIPVGLGPVGVAVTPNGAFVYVTNQFSDTVSVISTASNTVVGAPIAVGTSPTGLAITPSGLRAYVANQLSDNVSVIDLLTNTEIDVNPATPEIDRVAVGDSPDFVATSAFGGRIFVTNFGAGNVSVISNSPGSEDDNTVIETIGVGQRPEGIKVQGGR